MHRLDEDEGEFLHGPLLVALLYHLQLLDQLLYLTGLVPLLHPLLSYLGGALHPPWCYQIQLQLLCLQGLDGGEDEFVLLVILELLCSLPLYHTLELVLFVDGVPGGSQSLRYLVDLLTGIGYEMVLSSFEVGASAVLDVSLCAKTGGPLEVLGDLGAVEII